MTRALVLMAAFALAGCSDSAPGEGDRAPTESAAASVAEINAQPVTPSEGEIALTPLAANATDALGPSGASCAFAYQSRMLLTAATPAGKAKGLLVIDGRQIMLASSDDAAQEIESGVELTDGAWSATVLRAEGSPEAVAGGDRWPADLVVEGPEGEAKYSPGTWTCGS